MPNQIPVIHNLLRFRSKQGTLVSVTHSLAVIVRNSTPIANSKRKDASCTTGQHDQFNRICSPTPHRIPAYTAN